MLCSLAIWSQYQTPGELPSQLKPVFCACVNFKLCLTALVDMIVAQRSFECPIPGSAQGKAGWDPEQPDLVNGNPAPSRRVESR